MARRVERRLEWSGVERGMKWSEALSVEWHGEESGVAIEVE